jgi:plasmid replication initiation protein
MGRLQVVKANRLVQASYTLSTVEQRIVLLAVVHARESGKGIGIKDDLLHISAADYAQAFNVSKQAAQQALAGAVETLFNRRVTIDYFDKDLNQTIPLTVRWINAMSYLDDRAMIAIRFNPEIAPEFTRLESNFTAYMLDDIRDLNSAYSIRLYEIAAQWRSAGQTPLIELADFRQKMGLAAGEYDGINDFKKRVLNLAVSQINTTTDITLEYEQVKAGRAIKGFIFKIKTKKPAPAIAAPVAKKPKKAATPPANSAFAGLELYAFNDLKKAYPDLSQLKVLALAEAHQKTVFEILTIMNKALRDNLNSADLFNLDFSD